MHQTASLRKLLSWIEIQEHLQSLRSNWADYADVAIPESPLPKSIKRLTVSPESRYLPGTGREGSCAPARHRCHRSHWQEQSSDNQRSGVSGVLSAMQRCFTGQLRRPGHSPRSQRDLIRTVSRAGCFDPGETCRVCGQARLDALRAGLRTRPELALTLSGRSKAGWHAGRPRNSCSSTREGIRGNP